jgi:hypothetical protein
MKKILMLTVSLLFLTLTNITAQEVTTVAQFNRVIISPHVQATFIKGDKESVTIQSCTVNKEKVNIESNGKTLRVYLDDAKETTKNERIYKDGREINTPIYTGTVLTVTVTYKTLDLLSIRGEETILLKSKLDQEQFGLTVYGTGKVYIDDIALKNMQTTIYGESYVELKAGTVEEQKFTSYGESEVNALNIKSKVAKATLYGESKLNLNVSDLLKVTSFGESKVRYKGNPEIKKGITIGGSKISQIN